MDQFLRYPEKGKPTGKFPVGLLLFSGLGLEFPGSLHRIRNGISSNPTIHVPLVSLTHQRQLARVLKVWVPAQP